MCIILPFTVGSGKHDTDRKKRARFNLSANDPILTALTEVDARFAGRTGYNPVLKTDDYGSYLSGNCDEKTAFYRCPNTYAITKGSAAMTARPLEDGELQPDGPINVIARVQLHEYAMKKDDGSLLWGYYVRPVEVFYMGETIVRRATTDSDTMDTKSAAIVGVSGLVL